MKPGRSARTATVPVSARTGAGVDALLQTIDEALPLDPVSHALFRIPASEGAPVHLLHERAKVLSSRYQDAYCEVEAEVPESVKRRLARYLVVSDILASGHPATELRCSV